jgi:putative acetyltransferase
MHSQRADSLDPIVRLVKPADNAALAALVRSVLSTFGMTGEGCAAADPEVDAMYETYSRPRSAYFVVEQQGKVVGGSGIAPLKGAGADTCELQKTYLFPEVRGQGLGRLLVQECLRAAKDHKFSRCYLETFRTMQDAQALYRKCGFTPLPGPLGNTGHYQCTHWYIKEL